jgi:putative transposase
MPNHVHLVINPKRKLPEIMCWVKKATAYRANQILGRGGQAFWQREYYDRWIRTEEEYVNTVRYVEENPMSAGLENWRWCSGMGELHAGNKIAGGTGIAE